MSSLSLAANWPQTFFFSNQHRRADKCVDAAIWEVFTALHACVKCCAYEQDVF